MASTSEVTPPVPPTTEIEAQTTAGSAEGLEGEESEQLDTGVIKLNVITPDGEEITLEGISSAECVLTIRSALNDHPKTAHFSSYDLMLQTSGFSEGVVEGTSELNGMEPVIHVGKDGRVKLNDVFEMADYAVVGLTDNSTLYMMRSPYDLRGCRIHVRRLNELLTQPPGFIEGASTQQTDKYAESLVNEEGVKKASEALTALTADQKEGTDISAKVNALQTEARKWINRSEVQRKESDRVVVAQRMPHLSPKLSTAPSATLDGCSLSTSTTQNLGDFFPQVISPAMLDCEDRHVIPEIAALPHLAKFDQEIQLKEAGIVAASSSKALKNGESEDMKKKKKNKNNKTNDSTSSISLKGNGLPLSGCVRYVCASAWNPPPPDRKLAGDIMYLEVGLMENIDDSGELDNGGYDNSVIHITGTPNGWYVNSSKSPIKSSPTSSSGVVAVFNPAPRSVNGKFIASPELFGLLSSASKVFANNWNKALKIAAEKAVRYEDPLSMIGLMVDEGRIDSVVIKHSWCVPPPAAASASTTVTGHKSDWHRCQEDLNNNTALGSDERGALRDWNEEFQCFQELPVSNMLEKINRAKMIYKVWLEFQEAAVAGAQSISLGILAPINPTEPERQHVYVFNNTFFSYGVDSKDAYKVVGGDQAAVKSARLDYRNVQLLDHFQTTKPLQPAATEQAEAALKEAEEKDAELPPSEKRLCTLATALVDLPCGGRRLVAQSIIPGILSGDQISKLLLGAILHDVPLVQDEDMKKVLEQASQFFHIASREMPSVPLTTLPASTSEEIVVNRQKQQEELSQGKGGDTMVLHGAVELKGIVGSDDRKYILDCLRLTPRDANFIPTKLGGTGKWDDVSRSDLLKAELSDSHVSVLRPELVQRWKKRQEEFKNDKTKKIKLLEGETGVPDENPLNVNVFMPFVCAADKKIASEDEDRVRVVSKWLWDCILPSLTNEVRKGTVVPLDGGVLVELLHSFGINVRYMGRLAQLAKVEEESDLSLARVEEESMTCKTVLFPLYWRRMLETEMITRSAKHVFRRLLDINPDARLRPGYAITQFLNALFGNGGEKREDIQESDFEDFLSRYNGEASSSSVQTASTVDSNKSSEAAESNEDADNSTKNMSAAALKRMKKKKAAVASSTSKSSSGDASNLVQRSKKSQAELQQQLASLVLAPPASIEGGFNSVIVWALIAQEVRNRYRYELDLWPNPQLTKTWKGFNSEQEATKPTLLRRICQKLGLRIQAKQYNFVGAEFPFETSDILDAVPVPKSSGGHGPPGWSKALFQQAGPLSWLMNPEEEEETEKKEEKETAGAGVAEEGKEDKSAEKEEEKEPRSNALSPLPFNSGSSTGSGGHSALTPCPMNEVDELLAMAQVHVQNRQWGPVYELSQQAFALAQAVCGPLHRYSALALEMISKALFNLGDPEAAVSQQIKALAIHEQLGGFDTPDVASAHFTLAMYHHKLGSMEVAPRSPSQSLPNMDKRLDKAARHMRTAIYLFELLGGPLHPESADCYMKLGQFYHEASQLATYHEFPNSELGESSGVSNGGLGAQFAVSALRCYRESIRRQSLTERYYLRLAAESNKDGVLVNKAVESGKEVCLWSETCKCNVTTLGEDVLSMLTSETAKLAKQLGGGAEGAPLTNSSNANQPALLNRILQAQSLHQMATLYDRPLGLVKESLQLERVAYRSFRLLLGDNHHLSTTSQLFLQRFTELSVKNVSDIKAAKQIGNGGKKSKSNSQKSNTNSASISAQGSASQSVVSEADQKAADEAMQAMIEAEMKKENSAKIPSKKNKKSKKK